jgi:hypothetical protein
MKNLLALTAFLILIFAVVGWYRDWYHIGSAQAAVDGHRDISIDIDQQQIMHDVHKGEKEVSHAIENHNAKQAQPATVNAVPTTPPGQPQP